MTKIINDKWCLKKQLGNGGNGEVWEVAEKGCEGSFALKLIKKEIRERAYKRFQDEVEFMRNYNSLSGVIPIVDSYIPDYKEINDANRPYLVMPLAEPLNSKLDGMSFNGKLKVINDLLDMLCVLHKAKVAHRDIKPENVLYYNGQYVLSDYGLVFFQDKQNVTKDGERVGAKWTIAPEMEREGAYMADPYKADVYSMAKTIWIILKGNKDGFEGQYNESSEMIRITENCLNKYYSKPLESMLRKCTEHDPLLRPSAEEMKSEFNEWISINKEFILCSRTQWRDLLTLLFSHTLPKFAEWTSKEDIVSVLNVMSRYPNLNHMFFPDGGGLDLTSVSSVKGTDMIDLYCGGLHYYVKPKSLRIEIIGSEEKSQWNYLRLELDEMNPLFNSNLKGEYYEQCVEIRPSCYGPCDLLSNPDRYRGRYVPTEQSFVVSAYLKGVIVIFCKGSKYNQAPSTYDGRQSNFSTSQFRNYIEKCCEKNSVLDC